jgi:hypothetical protein
MIKKTRVSFPVLAALAAAAIFAGCGDSGDSSGDDPASVAPADTPVFVEAKIRPTGELRTNLEEIASRVAGVDDLGGTIVEQLEAAASDSDEPVDFEKDIQPWLGETAGIFLTEYDGDNFDGVGGAVAVTDTGAAQEFIDKRVDAEADSSEESYEGVDYVLDEDEQAFGLVGSFLVIGEDKKAFEAAVDASNDEALVDSDAYNSVSPSNPSGSLANVYVDIGGLVEMAGNEVDPDARRLLDATGVELEKSAALLSVIPGSDNVEIDVASKFGEEQDAVPTADASQMLGSLPADAVAAVGVGNLGESLGQVVDTIDEEGIPGEIPPNKFKDALKQTGIDIEKITSGLGNAAVFARGASLLTLSGALVIEAKNPSEARNTVSNFGTLLRASGTAGVTAVNGEAAGFSVRDPDLGRQPLVVAAKGDLIAIGYGLPATLSGLSSGKGATLSDTKAYNEALNSLGGTPITGFAAGRPAIRLIEGLIEDPDEKEEFEQARPYLSKIPFLAIGSEAKDDVVQAKVILGVTK